MTRPVYGYVYALVLRDWHEGRPPYIGKVVGPTEASITRRVWGKSASAHTSPESIARDPWKAATLPGRQGWMRLETVYSCGDPAEDDRALRRAEADWIYRRNPVHNDVRPVRPNGQRRPPSRPPAPQNASAPRRPAPAARPTRRRRRPNAKAYGILILVALFTFLTARVTANLPNPAAPWVISPAVGVAVGWVAFWRLHRIYRRLTR